jgi:hypothetical protein
MGKDVFLLPFCATIGDDPNKSVFYHNENPNSVFLRKTDNYKLIKGF